MASRGLSEFFKKYMMVIALAVVVILFSIGTGGKILYAQNIMDEQGSMVLLNVREEVKEIFLVTGFLDILTIR